MNTSLVKHYLRLIAEEHICGGFEDDERNYSAEQDAVWDSMSKEERHVANDLALGIFGPWISVD